MEVILLERASYEDLVCRVNEVHLMVTRLVLPSNPMLSPYLSKSEAADYLGVCEKTIDNYEKAGFISRIAKGRFIRFLRSGLDSFMQNDYEEPLVGKVNRRVRNNSLSKKVTKG